MRALFSEGLRDVPDAAARPGEALVSVARAGVCSTDLEIVRGYMDHRGDTSRIVVDEITLVGSRCGPFAPALLALADGSIDPTPLIEARYPRAEGPAALARAAESGALKVLIEP